MSPTQRTAMEAIRDGRDESVPQPILIHLWEKGLITTGPPDWQLRLTEAGHEALR